MHAAFGTCKRHFLAVAASYIMPFLLCTREAFALMSATRLNCGHHMQNSAPGRVPCHKIPIQVLCKCEITCCLPVGIESNQTFTWVYVQSAAVHPCPSSLSALLLFAICVCRDPRLLLGIVCHLFAFLDQAVRVRSCLGSRLGTGSRRVACLGVLVVDFASFSAC